MTAQGVELREDCWHADDPRCLSAPQMYRLPGRGVFRLSDKEIGDRKFRYETVPALLKGHETLAQKVADLDALVTKLIVEQSAQPQFVQPRKGAPREQ